MSNQKSSLAAKKALAKINTNQFNIPTRITSDESYEQGRALYKAIKTQLKEVQAKQSAILDPLRKSTAEVKALFAPVINSLEEVAEELHSKLGVFANEREEERQRKLEQINNDSRLKNPETILRKRNEVGHKVEGTMRIHTVVINDVEQIPDEYWTLDESAIRATLLAGGIVPGAYLKSEVTVTSK